MEQLKQDAHDLDNESDNSGGEGEPEEQDNFPEPQEAQESFHFDDGKGRRIMMGSKKFDVFQLANLASQFLNIPMQTPTKATPNYTP